MSTISDTNSNSVDTNTNSVDTNTNSVHANTKSIENLFNEKMKELKKLILKFIEENRLPSWMNHFNSDPYLKKKINEEKVLRIIGEINIYSSYSNELLSFIARSYFTKYISWWLPSYDVLEKIYEITKGKTILELGAGFGLMSALLSLLGSIIIGVDNNNIDKSSLFFNVENITIQESLEKYSDCEVLLIVWPLFHGFSYTEIFEKFKGNMIILIGEPNGFCTEDIFFPPNWNQIDHDVKVKNWSGIGDKLFIYEKLE